MEWDALLLAIVGGYGTYKTGHYSIQHNSLKYLGYTVSILFFTLANVSIVVESPLNSVNLTIYSNQLVEWYYIISISFALSGLALLIRESKPVFARFPLIYAAVPLLLIVSYWLIKDTLAIKEWLMSIYQGGALLVALLMYGVHLYRSKRYLYIMLSAALFLVTYVVYWFIPGMQNNYMWVWQLLLGSSLLLALYGLEYSMSKIQNTEQEHSFS